jgi:hypothetical protein
LCVRHHRIVDHDADKFRVDVLTGMKQSHENGGIKLTAESDRNARLLRNTYLNVTQTGDVQSMTNSPGAIQAGRDVNYNPRVVRPTVVQLGPQHLSTEQAFDVKKRVEDLVQLEAESGREPNYKKWWGKLKAAFRVPTYREIPAAQYDEAVSWLQQQGALIRPKLRRTNKPAWLKSHYTAIWAKANEMGMSKPDVYEFARSVLQLEAPPESLKDLGERQLDTLCKALFRHFRG